MRYSTTSTPCVAATALVTPTRRFGGWTRPWVTRLMPELFLIADTHLGHGKILTFRKENGDLLRPFSSLEAMHQTIEENWNRVVGPRDKVYHLGDVAFGREGLDLIGRLNGRKRLVRGNHDLMQIRWYLKHFQEVYGVRQINGMWLTHCPMDIGSVSAPRVKLNVHGHIHEKVIRHHKYFNACVEQIGYTPVSMDELLTKC